MTTVSNICFWLCCRFQSHWSFWRFCHSFVNAFIPKILYIFWINIFVKCFHFLLVYEFEFVTVTSVHHLVCTFLLFYYAYISICFIILCLFFYSAFITLLEVIKLTFNVYSIKEQVSRSFKLYFLATFMKTITFLLSVSNYTYLRELQVILFNGS